MRGGRRRAGDPTRRAPARGDVLPAEGRARLHDVAAEPPGRGRADADRLVGAVAGRCRDDELGVLEHRERRRIGVEQRRGLLDDRLQDGDRVELGREQAAGARELLGERTCRALGLEQATPVERTARGGGDLLRQLDVVARECALLDEAGEDEPGALAGNGDREQRRERRGLPRGVEAVVVRDVGGGEELAVRRNMHRTSGIARARTESGSSWSPTSTSPAATETRTAA